MISFLNLADPVTLVRSPILTKRAPENWGEGGAVMSFLVVSVARRQRAGQYKVVVSLAAHVEAAGADRFEAMLAVEGNGAAVVVLHAEQQGGAALGGLADVAQIGRAACRERVGAYV